MVKKILLLYISNISGHKSAANAIEKAINMLAPFADVKGMNFFNYVAPITEKVVNTMYMGVIKRAPIIWQVMYDNPRVVRSTSRARRFVYNQIRKKVDRLISQYNPDVVIATQAFPCEIISRYKIENSKKFRVFAVLTDFAPHSFWISEAVDYYIVATDAVKDKLIKKGVPEEKVKAFGIPIDPDFYFSKDSVDIRRRLGIGQDRDVVLLMGGGQGLGPIGKVLKSMDKVDIDFDIITICGNNKRLFRSVERNKKRMQHKVYNFGFVENVDEFMSIAKVLVTKAGGLTVSEAMAKGLPMIIMNSLPGQEYNNLKFLLRNRCALRAEDHKEVRRLLERLLRDAALWERLHKNSLITGRPNAALEVAHLALEM